MPDTLNNREGPKAKEWQPTPVLLPGKSHGQRSLVGYSPRGHEESDTTERSSPSACMGRAMEKDWPKRPLTASYNRLEKDSDRAITGGSLCPCTLGATRVPTSQAAAPPSRSTLTGAELPQAKKVLHLCTQSHFGGVQLFLTL